MRVGLGVRTADPKIFRHKHAAQNVITAEKEIRVVPDLDREV